MNLSAIYNEYEFEFKGDQGVFNFEVFSGVRDVNLKLDFDYFPDIDHQVKFGANATYHRFTPNILNASNGEVEFKTDFEPKYALEQAYYIQDDWRVSKRLSINAGFRYSFFTQLGPYESKVNEENYKKGEVVKTYYGWEPRLSMKLSTWPGQSIKAGVSKTTQYVHLVSNSSSTLPADVWVPSTEIVDPQDGIQYAMGYFANFWDNQLESSVEFYYKDLKNQIDYRDDYVNNVSNEVEDDFVFGNGKAYGAELFIKKAKGDWTGWLGYTWSRTERSFRDIENGRTYPAVYDRPHDLSLVGNYKLSDRWQLSAVFVYGTGKAYTPLQSLYFIENQIRTRYGPRNSERLDPYHRLDLSATYKNKANPESGWESSWNFSIYNVYNRKNPFFILYDFSTDLSSGSSIGEAVKVSIFPIIPSISWNFKWKRKSIEYPLESN